MSELIKGDYVLVHKPDDVNEPPDWIPEMDRVDNTIQKIISNALWVSITYGQACYYNRKWLTKVSPPDEVT